MTFWDFPVLQLKRPTLYLQPLAMASMGRQVSCKVIVVEDGVDPERTDVTVDGQQRIDDWLVHEQEVSTGRRPHELPSIRAPSRGMKAVGGLALLY